MEGNQMKMREALEEILRYLEPICKHAKPKGEQPTALFAAAETVRDMVVKALSAPARNCDLYNDVEDSWQDYKQFRSQTGEDVYFDMVHFWPFAKWLFAPAAERKGIN